MKEAKKVSATVRRDSKSWYRRNINEAVDIINRFYTEDGFSSYIEGDSIRIGIDDTGCDIKEFETHFCPETWDIFEEALKRSVCFLIQSEELDSFPYYKEILDIYSADLGTTDFVY